MVSLFKWLTAAFRRQSGVNSTASRDTAEGFVGIARPGQDCTSQTGWTEMKWRFVLALAIGAGFLAMLCGESLARSRPPTKYCLRGPTGGSACAYNTLQQCRLAASGTGGTCMRNPRYGRAR
jgi:hypothetical protein